MKKEVPNFGKRKAQAPVLLDEDDFYILYYLFESNPTVTPPYPEVTKAPQVIDLDYIKTHMNISHNSLITHTNRLRLLGFIDIIRKTGEDYKYKLLILTPPGRKFFQSFKDNVRKGVYNYLTDFKSEQFGKKQRYEDYLKELKNKEVEKK